MDGFYRLDFRSRADAGAGALALVNGKIAGLDAMGLVYKGTYSKGGGIGAGKVSGTVTVTNPTGATVQLVTGQQFPPSGSFEVPFQVSAGELTGHTIQLQAPFGVIEAVLTKIADF